MKLGLDVLLSRIILSSAPCASPHTHGLLYALSFRLAQPHIDANHGPIDVNAIV